MIKIRHAAKASVNPVGPVSPRPDLAASAAYDVAREIVALIEEASALALVVEIDDEDGEIEVTGAEFSNDGIAIIERAIQAALRNGGIRP